MDQTAVWSVYHNAVMSWGTTVVSVMGGGSVYLAMEEKSAP